MIAPDGFDDFVASRSPRLLRTAYLLTHDWAMAEDLPDAEIADILGCAVGTVRSQASRALEKLRLDEDLTREETLR